MDNITSHHNPLLFDFNPDLPPTIFEALLLPLRAQMKRLYGVEIFLAAKSKISSQEWPSIFTSLTLASCLAARYFDSSSSLQQVKPEIEDMASAERVK